MAPEIFKILFGCAPKNENLNYKPFLLVWNTNKKRFLLIKMTGQTSSYDEWIQREIQ